MLFFLHIDAYFCSFLLLAKMVTKKGIFYTHFFNVVSRMTTQEPIRYTLIIYNPYTTHLLYLKAHYVGALLEKYYYARRDELGVDAYYRMMRCAILERHHVKWVTRETYAMQRRVEKEHFGIDLVYCNIEYFLHRFTQVYRIADESIDYGFVGKPYKCETAMSRLFLDNAACEALRRSLYAYLEYYYLTPDVAKVETRVDLFFLLKDTRDRCRRRTLAIE